MSFILNTFYAVAPLYVHKSDRSATNRVFFFVFFTHIGFAAEKTTRRIPLENDFVYNVVFG